MPDEDLESLDPVSADLRDPKTDPQNGDILLRSDLTGPSRIRVCHGANPVEVDGKKVCWVRFELPLHHGRLKTVQVEHWRDWAANAEVIDEAELERLVTLWGVGL